MARIFISYHNSDNDLIVPLADGLRQDGHDVVFAGEITPGVDWRSVIEKQLSNSDVTLILLTKNSIKSQWVIAESSSAMAYVRERGRGAVIPIVFDQIDLPSTLSQVQSIYAYDRDISKVVKQIINAINELLGRQLAKDEKKRAARVKVEATAADFIAASQENLKQREKKYTKMGNFWYGAAYTSLILGVVAGVWRAVLVQNNSGGWINVAQTVIMGIVVIGLIIAVAKFSFTLGKSFMVEALRNADRSHAISFGEFYLRAYGDEAEWKEVKEAFQHWNIDKGSYFSSQNSQDFDPKLFETAIEIASIMSSKKDWKKKKES